MRGRAPTFAVAICMLFAPLGLFAQNAETPDPDPIVLLAAGRYAELDSTLARVQAQYRQRETTDEHLLAAFRPFYYLTRPGLEQNLDTWVREYPASYVAR